MNLVMYRMEDTERLRSKLRERRRVEDRQKAAFKEQRDIAIFQRMERNKRWVDLQVRVHEFFLRWRECKEKEPSLSSIQEDYAEEEDKKRREEEDRRRGSREEEEKRRGSRSSVKKLDIEKKERSNGRGGM